MSMRVHKGNDPTRQHALFLGHSLAFGASGPVWAGTTVSINPVNDSLGFISTVNDDGIPTGSVRDHGAPHLQRADEKVVNPRFA
jgi:hypothetical protein